MRKVIFSEQDKLDIINSYNNRNTITMIAKKYKTKPHRIKAVIIEAGITIRKHNTGLDENIFDTIDTPDKAYWLGFINGDGYNNVAHGWIKLKLGGIDKDHVYKFCKFMGIDDSCVRTEVHATTQKVSYSVNVCSKYLSGLLNEYGIIQAKSGNEHVVKVPDEFVRDYLRGLIDADGCIASNMRLDLSGSLEHCNYFMNIIEQELGIPKVKIHEHQHTKRIYYCKHADVLKIISYLYYDGIQTYLDRKMTRVNTCTAVHRQQLQKSMNY